MRETIAQLCEENLRLRRELWVQKRDAEANEAIFRRFHGLELALLDAQSLPDLVDGMIDTTQQVLMLDEVTLILDDPHREIADLVASSGLSLPPPPKLQFARRPGGIDSGRSRLRRPWLGPFQPEHVPLFSGLRPLASVARLPLLAQRRCLGSLQLGSADPERYTRAHAADFLHHLASVASLCLQNAINRERLVVDGHTDALTRWFNRRYLNLRLPREVARAVRYKEPLSGLLLDVDHFKSINDRYGHPVGDLVLRDLADRIRAELRSSDLAIRYGGEEFLVLLVCTAESDALRVAERIRRRVETAPFHITEDRSLHVTVSGGLAELSPDDAANDPAESGAAILHRADTALYRAKAGGRNRVVRHGDA